MRDPVSFCQHPLWGAREPYDDDIVPGSHLIVNWEDWKRKPSRAANSPVPTTRRSSGPHWPGSWRQTLGDPMQGYGQGHVFGMLVVPGPLSIDLELNATAHFV